MLPLLNTYDRFLHYIISVVGVNKLNVHLFTKQCFPLISSSSLWVLTVA